MTILRTALLLLPLAACTSAQIVRHVPQEVSGVPAQRQYAPAMPARTTVPMLAAPSTPAAPAARAPLIAIPQQAPVPPGPVPLTGCDAGGCWGSDGKRYDGGAGGAYLDKGGRLCQGNGGWMQCY